jgi:type I restriction enzyme R subunit
MYLSADPSRTISNFGDASLLQIIVEQGIGAATDKLPSTIKKSKEAVAETLEANMRKVIIQEMPINPVYYERMSVLLQDLVRQRKNSAVNYEQYLKKIEAIALQMKPENKQSHYPSTIDTPAKQAIYEIVKDEDITLVMEIDVSSSIEEKWIGNTLKERKVKYAISRHISDPDMIETILEVIKNQREYRK